MLTYQRTSPKAKKSHKCSLCGRTIEPGEVYMRGAGFGDGHAWTWRECTHCQAFLACCPGIYWDDTYGPDDFSEYEPRTFQESIWKMRWQRQWRHGNGRMAAVPSVAA